MKIKYIIANNWKCIKQYCEDVKQLTAILIDLNNNAHPLTYIKDSGFYVDYYWKGFTFDDIEKFLSVYFKGFLAIN